MTEQEFRDIKDKTIKTQKVALDMGGKYTKEEIDIIKQNLDECSNMIDAVLFMKNNMI